MSFAVHGLTHCDKCWTPLEMGEFGLCKKCQAERDEELRLQEEERKKNALKAEVVEEVRDEVKLDVLKELSKSKFESPIEELDISIVKPEGISFDGWYAEIGNKVIEMYQKGFDGVLINFVKEEIEDED